MSLPGRAFGRWIAAIAVCLLAAALGCDGDGDGGGDTVRVTTIAGGLNIGDDGPATATFINPSNVAVDARGDVLVVDVSSVVMHWILRRVDARTGTITTVGGPCDPYVQADPPEHVCDVISYSAIVVGGPNEIFLATHDQRLFRVDTRTGDVEHVAGRGIIGPSCVSPPGAAPKDTCLGFVNDLARDSAGNLYLAEPGEGVVERLDPSLEHLTTIAGKRGGRGCTDPFSASAVTATAACLQPDAVAVTKDGDLYVADTAVDRIFLVDVAQNSVSTIAGTGDACAGERGDGGPAIGACFVNPTSLAIQADGSLLVADQDRVRRIDAGSGVITTLAERTYVGRLALDADGGVVFTETNVVNRLAVGTGDVTTIAGNAANTICGDGGPGDDACIGAPYGAAPAPDGSVYFTDGDNGRIARVDAAGRVTTVVDHESVGSCGDTGPRLDDCLADPAPIVRDRDGTLYFADRGTGDEGDVDTRPGRVRRFNPASGTVTTIAGNCSARGSGRALDDCLLRPSSLLLDGRGGLYVGTEDGVHRIDLASGTVRHVVGSRHTGGVDCNADGIDAADACVAGSDLAIDAAGNLYAIAFDQYRVRRIDAVTGIVTTVAGNGSVLNCGPDGGPATDACVFPFALVVDGGRLIIADHGVFRIVDLATGIISTVPGFPNDCGSIAPIPEGCVFPSDLSFDDRGRLVVAETFSRSIRRVTLP